jgi:hypothetical protein
MMVSKSNDKWSGYATQIGATLVNHNIHYSAKNKNQRDNTYSTTNDSYIYHWEYEWWSMGNANAE